MVNYRHLNSSRRVLIVEPAGNLWGSERVLLDFLQPASASNWKIGVCCPPHSPIIPHLARFQIEIFPSLIANLHLKTRAHRLIATIRLLLTALTFRPKVLYVNQAGATKLTLLVGRILRLPVITHVRLIEDVKYLSALGRKANQLQAIVCVSDFILELLKAERNLDTEQLRRLYDPYAPKNIWNGEVPASPSADDTVSCVGRLTAIKGQDVLLRAIAGLKSEGVMVRALLVGDSPPGDGFRTKLRELAETLGIADQITWLGYQEDVFSVIGESVGQVCPSNQEPLGRVIFEAWDAGLVPIAFRCAGGSAETISASKGGILYDHQDPKSLATALKTLFKMKVYEREQMIRQGRQWLRDHCDPEEFSRSMSAVWQEALDSHRHEVDSVN